MQSRITRLKKKIAALQAHVEMIHDQLYDVKAELAEELNDEFVEMEMRLVALAERMQFKRLHQSEFEEAQ
jgi:hypothetical protein